MNNWKNEILSVETDNILHSAQIIFFFRSIHSIIRYCAMCNMQSLDRIVSYIFLSHIIIPMSYAVFLDSHLKSGWYDKITSISFVLNGLEMFVRFALSADIWSVMIYRLYMIDYPVDSSHKVEKYMKKSLECVEHVHVASPIKWFFPKRAYRINSNPGTGM